MTTISDALALLDDITQWRGQIPDAMATLVGLTSTWTTSALRGDTAGTLPFGLDHAHDTVSTDGPTGIRTDGGLQEMLDVLASWLDSAELAKPRDHEAATYHIRQSLTTVRPGTLATPLPWEDWAEWDHWCEELRATHAVVARLTGHARQTIGLCVCGEKLKARMGDDGRAEHATCPHGHQVPADAYADYIRRGLPAIADTAEDARVTMREARLIFPGLRAGTIRVWVHRGKLTPRDDTGRYSLAELRRLVYCNA